MEDVGRRFENARRLQMAVNRERTPSQRFEALCALLDVAAAMAPTGPEASERRRRALLARERERERQRERWREQHKRFLAAERDGAATGV